MLVLEVTVDTSFSTHFSSGSVFSTFFRHGQVLETFRGKGVFQPAVDRAIEKLNEGDWVRDAYGLCDFLHVQRWPNVQVHLFGEGKVNQPAKLAPREGEQVIPVSQHHANLLRFKWGVYVLSSFPVV